MIDFPWKKRKKREAKQKRCESLKWCSEAINPAASLLRLGKSKSKTETYFWVSRYDLGIRITGAHQHAYSHLFNPLTLNHHVVHWRKKRATATKKSLRRHGTGLVTSVTSHIRKNPSPYLFLRVCATSKAQFTTYLTPLQGRQLSLHT